MFSQALRSRVRGACCAAILALLGAARPSSAPRPLGIAYRIAMPDPAAHYFEVELRVTGIHADSLDVELPVWSPGRYARTDFARNLQRFAAADSAGKPIATEEENGSLWRLRTHGRTNAHITYRVFANTLSGTFSVLDTAHANWNGASVFVYVVGHKPDPVQLTVVAPPGWKVMNGAAADFEQCEFDFPNYWFERYVDGTEELPFAESLAKVGLTLTSKGDSANRSFVVAPAANATRQQAARREIWLGHDGVTAVQ